MIRNYKKSNLLCALCGVMLVTVVAAFGLTRAQEKASPVDAENKETTTAPGFQIPSIPDLEADVFENTKTAWQEAYSALNGDMTTGTYEQKAYLFWHTETLANLYRQKGDMDEALRLMEDFKHYIPLLEKAAKETENEDEKEGLLRIISRTHSTFAQFGMYDEAIATAKLSPETRQYNASEYLKRVANIMASKEPFDKVVPVLDEAITAAKKLPSEFWQNRGIIDVAELYAKAGRMQKARELVDSLSPYGKARGLLVLADILIKKEKSNTEILPLLREAEIIAKIIDDDDDQSHILNGVALKMVQLGNVEEGMRVFEKSTWASDSYRQDDFHTDVAYHFIEQGKLSEAESLIEKIQLPTFKARVLMSIIRSASIKSDIATMKRLIPIVEPYLADVEPFAHRLHNQLYLAAYKIRVGDEEEGRKMMDDLIAGPYVEGLDRDDSISRAVGGLCYAGLYDEAVEKVKIMTSPVAKASAYELIKNIYIQNERPEEYRKTIIQHWEVLEDVEE